MRNLKRALSLALASVMLLGMMVVGTSAASYPDVKDSDNVEAIEVLNAVGVMIGKKGKFDPDAPVNRHEMAAIMARLVLGEDAETYVGNHPFTDVYPWADKYVAACYENGIINGTSKTTFSGNQPLTAIQAATMMLRALGYEHLTKGAADWRVPVASQANKIGLFRGVTSSPSAQLTRNQVAQLALNTLESDMVDFTGELGWEINGVSMGTKLEWTPRKDLNNVNQNGYNYTNDTATTHQKEYLQLLEDLYDGKLTKDTHDEDDYDRPATTWKYNGKVIGSYMNTPDLTYTAEVKLGDIYKDLGLGDTVRANKVDFSRNGMYENVTNTMTQDNKGNALSGLDLHKGDDDHKIGANGVLTQVWWDSDNEKATITMIDTYVGKIGTVVRATSSADRYVTMGLNTCANLTSAGNKFETENFDVNDIVSFNVVWNGTRYDLDRVNALEMTTTGTLTRWVGSGIVIGNKGTSNSNFTVSDNTYKYSAHSDIVDNDGNRLTNGVADFTVNDSEINVYLDEYGYALYVSGVEGEKNYAAVIGTGSTNPYGDQTTGVTLLLPDGTQKSVTAKLATGSQFADKNGVVNGSNGAQLVKDAVGDLVSYTIGDNNVYELTVLDNYDTTTGSIGTNSAFTNGKSLLKLGSNSWYTTDQTIFFVCTDDGATNKTYNVYTGYANMPSFDTAGITGFAVKLGTEYTSQVEAIYISAANLAGVSSVDTYFVKKAGADITTDKKNGISYYTLPAIVDGAATTIKVKATISDIDDNANDVGLWAITNVITNSDGIITSYVKVNVDKDSDGDWSDSVFNATGTSGKDYGTGTVRDRNGVLGIGTTLGGATYWAYTSDTKVYRVDKDYKDIQVSSISDVYTDTDDRVYASMDDDTKTLTDVIIVNVENNGSGGGGGGTVNNGAVLPNVDGIDLGTDFTPAPGSGEANVADYVVRDLKGTKTGSRLILEGTVGKAYQFDENSTTDIAGFGVMKDYFTQAGTPKTTANGSDKIAVIAVEAEDGEIFLWLVGNKTTDFVITHTAGDGTTYSINVNVAGLEWK